MKFVRKIRDIDLWKLLWWLEIIVNDLFLLLFLLRLFLWARVDSYFLIRSKSEFFMLIFLYIVLHLWYWIGGGILLWIFRRLQDLSIGLCNNIYGFGVFFWILLLFLFILFLDCYMFFITDYRGRGRLLSRLRFISNGFLLFIMSR